MKKQEFKIEYDGSQVFFFEHDLKTALEHAEDFIERNKGKFEMKLFALNKSNFGEKWTFIKKIK